MRQEHTYAVHVTWTGNTGTGTSGYREYSRQHTVAADCLPAIAGSADPTFHGDRDRYNPEQLLLAALTQCHMLSYLHHAVRAGVRVTAYTDTATGTMRTSGSSGSFQQAVLHPRVTVASPEMREAALHAHEGAHRDCFIANSVNFEVVVEPQIIVQAAA